MTSQSSISSVARQLGVTWLLVARGPGPVVNARITAVILTDNFCVWFAGDAWFFLPAFELTADDTEIKVSEYDKAL